MKQKYPNRFLNRLLGESEVNFKKRREAIFDAITDQIDFYSYIFHDFRYLSSEQREDLQEAAEAMVVFGERGEQWHNQALQILDSVL